MIYHFCFTLFAITCASVFCAEPEPIRERIVHLLNSAELENKDEVAEQVIQSGYSAYVIQVLEGLENLRLYGEEAGAAALVSLKSKRGTDSAALWEMVNSRPERGILSRVSDVAIGSISDRLSTPLADSSFYRGLSRKEKTRLVQLLLQNTDYVYGRSATEVANRVKKLGTAQELLEILQELKQDLCFSEAYKSAAILSVELQYQLQGDLGVWNLLPVVDGDYNQAVSRHAAAFIIQKLNAFLKQKKFYKTLQTTSKVYLINKMIDASDSFGPWELKPVNVANAILNLGSRAEIFDLFTTYEKEISAYRQSGKDILKMIYKKLRSYNEPADCVLALLY